MHNQRTSLRIPTNLKKAAEKIAREENTTMQAIFNKALKEYLNKRHKQKADKLVLLKRPFDKSLDNLTRDDIYGEPTIPD